MVAVKNASRSTTWEPKAIKVAPEQSGAETGTILTLKIGISTGRARHRRSNIPKFIKDLRAIFGHTSGQNEIELRGASSQAGLQSCAVVGAVACGGSNFQAEALESWSRGSAPPDPPQEIQEWK